MSNIRQFTFACGLVVLLLAVCQPKDMESRWSVNLNQAQKTPIEQWQGQGQDQGIGFTSLPYQQQQGMPQTTYTMAQWQQMQLQQKQLQQKQIQPQQQQQRLAAEVSDMRKPIIYYKNPNNNNNDNNINYNRIPPLPPSQQQKPQLPATHIIFNNPQPNYNYYNNNRYPPQTAKIPLQLPRNYTYLYGKTARNNNNLSAEQFETFNSTQRSARTFGFISDFITGLIQPCVDPCTITAYYQNRCCNAVPIPQPPVCCPYPPLRPQPPIMPPIPPPPPPPISCCNTCSYGYYGPAPCFYNDGGGFRRAGNFFGGNGGFLGGGYPGGLYLGGNLGIPGFNSLGGQIGLSLPRPAIFG